jgi:hypothetical protein
MRTTKGKKSSWRPPMAADCTESRASHPSACPQPWLRTGLTQQPQLQHLRCNASNCRKKGMHASQELKPVEEIIWRPYARNKRAEKWSGKKLDICDAVTRRPLAAAVTNSQQPEVCVKLRKAQMQSNRSSVWSELWHFDNLR